MCKNYLYCAVVKEPLAGLHRPGKCFSFQNFSRGILHPIHGLVGLTGLEPVTLRLSSACSNQLSYRPQPKLSPSPSRWRHGDSNPRPIACKATALPAELCPQSHQVHGIGRHRKFFRKIELCGPRRRGRIGFPRRGLESHHPFRRKDVQGSTDSKSRGIGIKNTP